MGYFSSTGNYDGIWLENDGTTVYLKAARAGVETISVAMEDWSGYSDVQGYNWNNFTVILFDFLWLGGAILNFWMKLPDGFLLVHSVPYAGIAPDIFIRSPNQPVRYEIRGVSGTGSLRYICCQVATEGSIEESGANRSVDTGSTGISMALLGTTYPLKAIRKKSDHRDIAVSVDDLLYLSPLLATLLGGLFKSIYPIGHYHQT